MKRLLFWALAAVMFAACVEDVINEQSIQSIVDDAPESLTVGFEENDTRVQLNEANKTVWTNDDLVSVFYRSDANQKWQYQGETGERVGNLERVDAGTATRDMDRVVVVYPYNEDYYINPSTFNIQATLPAIQTYLKDSYGVGCNLMVSQSEFTQFSLKSVCGWLKLQLTGNGEVVKSIKFRGNNDEQVAGLIYVDTDTAESTLASEMGSSDDNNVGGNLTFDDTILTEVTLDCGEGVTLGAESTAFYIALPPQTFTEGFTVEVNCEGYSPMTISTSNKVVIERNHIQPMAAKEHDAEKKIPDNEIWYTSSDGNIVTPYHTYSYIFGTDIVSNTYENGQGIITFDGCVTNIGDWAFYDCSSLTSITIPDSVIKIEFGAFYGCSNLSTVIIGDSVTSIGDNAFQYCSSLISVNIPNCVTSIERCAFSGCSSLTSVTIGDSVTSIGELAFGNCNSLTTVTIPDNVTIIGNSAFYCCNSLTSVTIGDSVTSIGEYAFYSCSSLTGVNIPNSVTSIGEYAFYSCSSLTSVSIPDCVTSIERCAFYRCSSLTSVTIGDSVTTIGNSAFQYCSSLTSVTIGDSVTSIGEYAFNSCSSLTGVNIPNSVTLIGEYAFYSCSGLTSVSIPDCVTSIERCAFDGCSSLTSVTIGESVTSIGIFAFCDCSSLTTVTIPDSVTSIGNHAFYWCFKLTSVYCKPTTPPAVSIEEDSWYAFYNNASDRKIYVPTASVEAYKSASGWSDYADCIVGYDF